MVKNFLKVGLTTLLFTLFASTAFAATVHVNSAYDGPDAISYPDAFDTELTLREAIAIVNGELALDDLNAYECGLIFNDADTTASSLLPGCTVPDGDTLGMGGDTIVFDFDEETVIGLSSNLEYITANDTYVYGANNIVLDGGNLIGPDAWGLRFENTTGGGVHGMTFQNFSTDESAGLYLLAVDSMRIGAFNSSNPTLHNHFWNNTYGVYAEGLTYSSFRNNYVGNNGEDSAGNAVGIKFVDSDNNEIGEDSLGGGNYIGGNESDVVLRNSNNNVITNNYINALPEDETLSFNVHPTGVTLQSGSSDNEVVGNYFAGFSDSAIFVKGTSSDGNVLRLNIINSLAEGAFGILLSEGSNNDVPTPELIYPTTNNAVFGNVDVPDASTVDIYVANSVEEAAKFAATVEVEGGSFKLTDFPLDPLLQYVTANVTTADGSSQLGSYLNDTDGDGVSDEREDTWWAAEEDFDPDGDGLLYYEDVDADGDGLEDGEEDLNGDAVLDEGESSPVDYCDPDSTLPGCPDGPVDDTDTDEDGVIDSEDNCPTTPNPLQEDADDNGIGDACEDEDVDTDGDGVIDSEDNCPVDANPLQEDADDDGIGDVCDDDPVEEEDPCDDAECIVMIDVDEDGIAENEGFGLIDNCPTTYNPGQEDSDMDGYGDACDTPAFSQSVSSGGGGGFSLPPSNGYIPVANQEQLEMEAEAEAIAEAMRQEQEQARAACRLIDIYGHWSRDYVQDLCERGVVKGYGKTKVFGPDRAVNRAEFTKMLVEAMEVEVLETNRNPFSDVPAYEWYGDYVNTAKEYGIVTGYLDGTFRPGNEVSRAEAVKMVLAAMGERPGGVNTFTDTVGHWAEGWIARARAMRLVAGYTADTFAPNAPLLRGEAAKLILMGAE